jgi:hypothetical protein
MRGGSIVFFEGKFSSGTRHDMSSGILGIFRTLKSAAARVQIILYKCLAIYFETGLPA